MYANGNFLLVQKNKNKKQTKKATKLPFFNFQMLSETRTDLGMKFCVLPAYLYVLLLFLKYNL